MLDRKSYFEIWALRWAAQSFPAWNLKERSSTALAVETRSPLATGPDLRGEKKQKMGGRCLILTWCLLWTCKNKTKRKQSGCMGFPLRQTHSGMKEKSNIKNTIFGFHTEKGSARKSLHHLFTCFSAVTTASLGIRREQILLWLCDSWRSCHCAYSWSWALATWPLDILAQDFKPGSLGFETRRAPVHLATTSSSSCRYSHRTLGLCSFLSPSLVLFLF